MRILAVIFLALPVVACSEKEDSAIVSKQPELIASRALPNVVLAASSATTTSSVTDLPAAAEIASSAVSENQPANIQRDAYQSIIEKQFPGFRILKAEDFDESVRSDVADGVSGALVIGNFDFDKHKDFAAMLIGNMKNTYKPDASRSYNVYNGMLVICHGNAKGDGYLCEERGKTVYYGLSYSTLSIVPPGRHECEFNDGAKEIVTSIDGIGEYSEKAGGFIVLQKDGTYFSCADSD